MGPDQGYEMLRSTGFPRAIGGAYRLDTLAAWEDRQLAGTADTSAQSDDVAVSGHPTTGPETSTPSTDALSGEGAAWSPSTRRPATGRGVAGTNGGK